MLHQDLETFLGVSMNVDLILCVIYLWLVRFQWFGVNSMELESLRLLAILWSNPFPDFQWMQAGKNCETLSNNLAKLVDCCVCSNFGKRMKAIRT